MLYFCFYADIDECQSGRNNCSQTCFNTVGSFKCGCLAGYSLDVDNSTCTGECIPVSVCVCMTCISLQSNVSLCAHVCLSVPVTV